MPSKNRGKDETNLMHIPDGLLDSKTVIASGLASLLGLAWAVRTSERRFDDRAVPLMGVTAAFIFAAQMINFPVAGGTSGHLLGGVLAMVALGLAPAMVVMTAVVLIQALLFGDGGVLALGANILNMAIVAPLTGYLICRPLGQKTLVVFLAAWASVVASSLVASIQLSWSGIVPLSVVIAPMLGWHTLIGLGEGAITVAVIHYLRKNGIIGRAELAA